MSFGSSWELPGGGIDDGETYVETALRELARKPALRLRPLKWAPRPGGARPRSAIDTAGACSTRWSSSCNSRGPARRSTKAAARLREGRLLRLSVVAGRRNSCQSGALLPRSTARAPRALPRQRGDRRPDAPRTSEVGDERRAGFPAVGLSSPLSEPDLRLSLRIRLSGRHGEVWRSHPCEAEPADRHPGEQVLLGAAVSPELARGAASAGPKVQQ
jgi:hypothetical protein